MRVLLVSPPSAFFSGSVSPSLGLATLAASLGANGIDCRCVDGNFLPGFEAHGLMNEGAAFEERMLRECLDAVVAEAPDVVGISSWGVALPFSIVLSRSLKKLLPEATIVAGGISDEELAEEFMRLAPQVDATVVGEGEETLPELVSRIAAGHSFEGVAGLVRRANGALVREAPPVPLPPERWASPEYDGFVTPLSPTRMIEGSRSCPYKCVFCSINGMPFRRKKPEVFAREILETQASVEPDVIFLADNYIPLSGDWTEALCEALGKSPRAVRWTCCARADRISPRTTQRMVDAGLERIFLGVESVSWDTLTYIYKSKSVARYLAELPANIDCLTDQGIGLRISPLLGFPTEGAGDMQRTIDFVLAMRERGLDAYTGPLVAYPGSRLWAQVKSGELRLRKIDSARIRRNCSGMFADAYEDHPALVPNNFMPEHKFLPPDELEEILLDGLDAVRHYREEVYRNRHQSN